MFNLKPDIKYNSDLIVGDKDKYIFICDSNDGVQSH